MFNRENSNNIYLIKGKVFNKDKRNITTEFNHCVIKRFISGENNLIKDKDGNKFEIIIKPKKEILGSRYGVPERNGAFKI